MACHLPEQRRKVVSGIPEERCDNEFRGISADFKEVKTTNLKFSAKQKVE